MDRASSFSLYSSSEIPEKLFIKLQLVQLYLCKFMWAKEPFQQTLLWLPGQKFTKFVVVKSDKSMSSFVLWKPEQSWKPDAISGIAMNPEGLA